MTFNIGDTVYLARFDRVSRRITCPDCGGSTRVKVVLHDGTEVSVDCGGCNPGGRHASQGWIRQFGYVVRVTQHVVSSVILKADEPTEYRLDTHEGRSFCGDARNTFATREEAQAHGETLRQAAEDEENARLLAKTKDGKSRSWNYHLREAKRCREDAARHEAKAVVCKAHVKGGPK